MTGTANSTQTPIDWDGALRDHTSWLRSVVAARLGEPQAVEDVLQNVALAASKGGPPGLGADKVAPWLYQVAVRQTLMYRRTAGRRRKLVGGFAERVQPRESDSRESDPLEWLLAQERATCIRQAMATLHQRDREILMLKYEQGWSYHELAQHLGISHSAVEARLHRARKRLREKLTRDDMIGPYGDRHGPRAAV